MNKIYKTVWNALRHCLVVVSEATKSASQQGSTSHANGSEIGVSSQMKPVGFKYSKLALSTLVSAIVVCFTPVYAADWYQSAKNADEKIINTDATYGTMTMDGWYEKFNADNTPDEVMNFENTRYKNYLTIENATVTTGHLQQNAMGGRWNDCPGGSWWYYQWSAKFWVKDGAQFTANTAQIDGYYYQDGGISNIGTLSLDWHNGKRVPSRSAGTLEVNGGMMTIGTLDIADNNVYTYVNGGALEVGTQGGNGTLYLRDGDLSVDGWNANGMINMSGGTFNTPLDSVAPTTWNIAKVNGLLFNSSDTQASLNASAIHKSANVGELKNDWVKHFTISGGTVNFTGTYTQTQADRATTLIQSKFGNNIKVTFDQVVADTQATDVSQGLTMAISSSIIAENDNTRVDGTIFTQHKYDARTQNLLIGDVKGVMTNVGYTAFNGDMGATVSGGKTLALLGLGDGSQITTGTLDIQDGTLRLGTNNTSITVGGIVSSVVLASSGILNTIRGNYNVNSITGSGVINADSGSLNVQTLDLSGELNNKSSMTVANAANVGRGTNSGTLSMSDLNLTDSFTNTGTANINGALSFNQKGHYTQTAGVLNTLYSNIFTENIDKPDDLNTIGISASIPEKTKTTLTDLFTLYIHGEVAQDLVENATFTGGKVVVNGDGLTETQRDDLTTAFKETFFHSKKERFPMLVPYRTSIGKRFYFLRTKKLLFIFKIFLGRNRLEIDIKRFKNMKESRKLGISFIAQSSIQPSASHPNFSGKLSNASGTRNITKCFFNKLPIACIFHKTRLKVKLTIVFIFQKILNVKRNQFFFCHLFNLQIFKQAFSFLNIRFLSTLIATNKQYHDFQISDGVIQPITWAIVNFGFAHAFSQRADLSKMAILHISYSSHDQLPCQSIFWFKRLEPFLESFSEFNDINHLINSLNVYHSIHKNNEVMYESNI